MKKKPSRKECEEDLARRKREHLDSIKEKEWQPCQHDSCPHCIGTFLRKDGSQCTHKISCSCPKCSPYRMGWPASYWTWELTPKFQPADLPDCATLDPGEIKKWDPLFRK